MIKPDPDTLLVGLCLLLLFFYFLGERLRLAKKRRAIPLRICISGIRGKSTLTRLIASSLREAGFAVLAKTTGSKPVLIFPDGQEKEIERRGLASILEQKILLGVATKLKVQALVAEMMSIQPECISAESRKILVPHILVITNVRLDHLDLMGKTREEIGLSLSSSIAPGSTVFIPQEEYLPVFGTVAEKLKAKIIQVKKNSSQEYFSREFEENIRLALAVTDFLGLKKETALQGMKKAQPDFGSLKIFQSTFELLPQPWYLVSAFAANDPESTGKALLRVKEMIPFSGKKIIGLLNLREDRGDRTLQWFRALEEGFFSEFSKLIFIGAHARAISRKKRFRFSSQTAVTAFSDKRPERIMEKILAREKEEAILFGMGNMGGLGKKLVEYWEKIGKPYGN